MKTPQIKANNSSGKQTLDFHLYDETGTPDHMKGFNKDGKHVLDATVFGIENGKRIQIDFDSLNKKQFKKFIHRLKKLYKKMI